MTLNITARRLFVPVGIGLALLAAQLYGCKFGTGGLDGVPDSAVVDAAVDADAAPEGGPGCTPGAFRCNETFPAQMEICDGNQWQLHRTCDYFCKEVEPDQAICSDLYFSNSIQTVNFIRAVTTVPLNLQAAQYVIDTDNEADPISGPGTPDATSYYIKVLPRTLGNRPFLILTFQSIDIPDGCRITVVGSRPLVLLSQGDITIAGTIDATADGTQPGPGGYVGGENESGGEGEGGGGPGDDDLTVYESGGGGGGHADLGGAGGDVGGAMGGTPGGSFGNPQLVPLVGGSGGGSGGLYAGTPGAGGGGGGAIMVASVTSLTITSTGGINVGGGGGRGGLSEEAGGGGGSGGAILLAAPTINIDVAGTLSANGGGGGGADNGVPLNGEGGQLGDQAAAPGQYGGSGGAGMSPQGESGGNSGNTYGGGGGGACGRIRIEHLMSPAPTFAGAVISPGTTPQGYSLARMEFL